NNTPDGLYLMDGRNRLDALDLRLPPTDSPARNVKALPRALRNVVTWAAVDDPVALVIAANIHRRHLPAADRVHLARQAMEVGEAFGKTAERSAVSGGRGRKAAARKLAEAVGVDPTTARTELVVAADPTLDAAVKAGKLTPKAAHRKAREKKKAKNADN